jgi:putative drug exporter of the RND superfamily
MSYLLTRLGRSTARHPWRTIGAWLIVLAALFGLNPLYGDRTQDDYNIPGLESTAGTQFLAEHFPERSGTDARVVIHGDHPPAEALLGAVTARLQALPGVSVVDRPRMSADGDTALIGVHYSVPVTNFHGSEGVDALDEAWTPGSRRSGGPTWPGRGGTACPSPRAPSPPSSTT